ncbi:unnamed protein product, partial [marine sediment metagenome]
RDLIGEIDVTKDTIDEIFDAYDDGDYDGDEEFALMDEARDVLDVDVEQFPTRGGDYLPLPDLDTATDNEDGQPVLDEEDEAQEDEEPPTDPMVFDWDRVEALSPDDEVDAEGVALLEELGQEDEEDDEEEEETPSIVRKRARDEQLSPSTPTQQAPDLSTAPPAPKRRRTSTEGRYLKTYSSGYPDRSVTRRIVPLAKKGPFGTNLLVLRDVYTEETDDDGVTTTTRGEIELDRNLFTSIFADKEYFERK